MSRPVVGYIPYSGNYSRQLWGWIAGTLELDVVVLDIPSNIDLNRPIDLPDRRTIVELVAPYLRLPHVVVEGPGGLLWASLLRVSGFRGAVTAVAHVNPTSWHDVKALALFRRFLSSADRLYVGSTRSADVYRGLGLPASVGHPFGIDSDAFTLRDDAIPTCRGLGISPGPLLVFAGRVEADKSVHTVLRVAIKARLLFPDLKLVIAASTLDPDYETLLRPVIDGELTVLIRDPTGHELAAVFGAADAFVTAATSEYETFGRAPVEAMACGATAIAPRYDGFCDTLAQPGGVLVDLQSSDDDVAVDESALLRAVYDRLSSSSLTSRQAISYAARSRFSRERTIRMLAHLGAPPDPHAATVMAPTLRFQLPGAWSEALHGMFRLPQQEAVDWTLAWLSNVDLCDFDLAFRRTVRRFLAGFAE